MLQTRVEQIANETQLPIASVRNALALLVEQEASIPFIARYRKEQTGSLDEVTLGQLRDRYAELEELATLRERHLKVCEAFFHSKPERAAEWPVLRAAMLAAPDKATLEDLYLPYKPKRRTRAETARLLGLEPLLADLLSRAGQIDDLHQVAAAFQLSLTAPGTDDPKLAEDFSALTPERCLGGAADLLAERVAETASLRASLRQLFLDTAQVRSIQRSEKSETPNRKRTDPAKYETYFDFSCPAKKIQSHQMMAIRRGEAEKILRLQIEVDSEAALPLVIRATRPAGPLTAAMQNWCDQVARDAYRRLLEPSLEAEIRLKLKEEAEAEAINVFATNLEKLLLLPPLPSRRVLGIDPGLRTGSKLAAVDSTGKLLAYTTVTPRPGAPLDHPSVRDAAQTLATLISEQHIDVVAIGNGTGSREIGQILTLAIKTHALNVRRVIVNEAGASVYSTDAIAREEFPDLDPTIRSAVSIARRLQDPLAELVKVDPKSIGVGQYQHDCNPARLARTLGDTVASCVNRVGVDLNTASPQLLSHVAGLSQATAQAIVTHRNSCGAFRSRSELLQVRGLGAKTFEQAAGFLRIPGGDHLLDNSAVHPESYDVVETLARDAGLPLSELIGNETRVRALPLEQYVSERIGLPTLLDIQTELAKPGRDPRAEGTRLLFSDEVSTIADLKVGMWLKGTVSNVTKFGAFVDIGVHQDGLVHVSELADRFVANPSEVVAVGDIVNVRVSDVDLARSRIGLSCRHASPPSSQAAVPSAPRAAPPPKPNPNRAQTPRPQPRAKASSGASLSDLLHKFNGKRS